MSMTPRASRWSTAIAWSRVLAFASLLAIHPDALYGQQSQTTSPDATNVQSQSSADRFRDSTVRIVSTRQAPDFQRPWSRAQPNDATGSGTVISDRLVLTNYHVVRQAQTLDVFTSKGGESYRGTVAAIAPTVDLALIELPLAFADAHVPIAPLDDRVPAPRDAVVVYGFPLGAKEITSTKGIVSRFEYVEINYGGWGARLQVDAATNYGNSGGPVFSERGIVGVSYAGNFNAENTSYAISTDEVKRFVEFAKANRDQRIPAASTPMYWFTPWLEVNTQRTDSAWLRSTLGAVNTTGGVLIRDLKMTALDETLHRGDLLLAIEGVNIDSQGRVAATPDWQVDFRFLLRDRAGKKIRVDLVRKGLPITTEMTISAGPPDIMLPILYESSPSYAVIGPMVIQVGSYDLASSLVSSKEWLMLLRDRASPLEEAMHHTRQSDEQVLVMSGPLLPHPSMMGMPNDYYICLKSVNGRDVRNLRHLIDVVGEEIQNSKYLAFEFWDSRSPMIAIKSDELVSMTRDVQLSQSIARLSSPDIREAYKGVFGME